MTAGLLKAAGDASLSAGVMILAVMILRLWFQDRTPRRAFCLLWDIVLIRLLILRALPSPVSVWKWLPELTANPAAVHETPIVAAVMDGVLVRQDVLTIEGVTWLAEDAVQAVPGTGTLPPLSWDAALAVVWLTVVLLLAFGFLWSHLRSRGVYAASLPVRDPYVLDWLASHPLRRPVQARVSDRIDAPLTYGVLYPVILLPRGMEDREVLSCVLAHEHNHIRRFDALRKIFFAAAFCLHWFNPLVWAMYVLANRDMELACDEAVLRDGADREQYALALLGLEERRGRWRPSGSHFSGHALEERIKSIMKRKHISMTALAAVLIVMCVTTTVFASTAPEGGDAKAAKDRALSQTGILSDHLQVIEDTGVSILSKDGENGGTLYSDDGGRTWMSEERFHAKYGGWGDNWRVEWWTYEDYKTWLKEEKEALQSIIGDRGYTSSKGWFTWDQELVDETIAMYEGILEEIKNGALYSKTIIDKSGNEIEDVVLGSDGLCAESIYELNGQTVTVPELVLRHDIALYKAELREKLKAFGIEGDGDRMTYGGELVRTFVDGVPVGDDGYAIAYVYRNDQGTADLHTLRAATRNPDGSYDPMGELAGLAAKGDKDFDQRLIDCAVFSEGPVEATYANSAEGSSAGRGKTLDEIFARYEQYGLIYQTQNGGMGSMTYNGLTVCAFADLKPDGGAFSYEDPNAEDGLTVRTVYDENGNLIGLAANPMPVKAYSQEKQELGFGHCTPVDGKISSGFGIGENQFHYGVDLAAEKGTDIAAFAYGVVSETGFDAALGNYVVLTHANGYTTLYAHCGSVSVVEDNRVTLGQKIAEVGASGTATGPVLHFELRSGETYLDPAQYLDLGI